MQIISSKVPVTISWPDAAVIVGQQTGNVLADFVATLAPGTWGRLPDAANADVATASPGSIGNIITNFANATAYDPVRKRIPIVGGAHGVLPKLVTFDLVPHSWSVLLDPSIGSHPFQHVAVDPATGDTFLMAPMPAGTSTSSFNLFRWNGSAWDDLGPMPEANATYSALAWWNGQLTWYNGTFGWIWARDAATGTWSPLGRHPAQQGAYHNVSAPTKDGLVFGGGNIYGQGDNPTGRWPLDQTLFLLAPDKSITQMPDAPFRVGMAHGMLVYGDGKGRANLLGFGQHLLLDPAAKTLTRLPDPPAELLPPGDPPSTSSIIACAIDELGCSVCVQWESAKTPHTSVWMHKAA